MFSRARHPYKSRHPPSPQKRQTNKQNNSMLTFRVWEFTTAKGHFCDSTAWCVMRTMDEKSTKWNKASLEAHQDTLWSIFILRYNVMCYFFTLIAELRGWDTWTLPSTFQLLFWMPPKALLESGGKKKPAKFFYPQKIPEWKILTLHKIFISTPTLACEQALLVLLVIWWWGREEGKEM